MLGERCEHRRPAETNKRCAEEKWIGLPKNRRSSSGRPSTGDANDKAFEGEGTGKFRGYLCARLVTGLEHDGIELSVVAFDTLDCGLDEVRRA